jgi:hypothetical protein
VFVAFSVFSFNLSTLWCVDSFNPAASQASGNFAGDAVARQTNTFSSLQTNKSDRKKKLIKPDQGMYSTWGEIKKTHRCSTLKQ